MLSTSTLLRAAALGALVITASSADATIGVYNNEASFLAALSLTGTDRFDDLDAGQIDGPLQRTAGSFGYSVFVGDGDPASFDSGFYRVGSPGDPWLSTVDAVPIVFGEFASGVQAVGGYFFVTDLDGQPQGGEGITVTFTDLAGSLHYTLVSPEPTTFLGFITDSQATALRIAPVDTGSNNAWATVNDLSLGLAIAPIPEPQTTALMLGGLAALGATLRRRART